MKTKQVLFVLIFVSFITLVAFLGMKNRALRRVNSALRDYNTELASTARTHEFKSVEIKSIGFSLPDAMTLIDEFGDTVSMLDVLGEQKTLVFRYSSLQCNSCVDSQLEIMHDVLHGEKYNILFLACYNNPRDLIVFKKSHSIDYPIFLLSECSLPLLVDAINEPYFFVMDKNMVPEYLFVPQERYPQLSIDYLSNIAKLIAVAPIQEGPESMVISSPLRRSEIPLQTTKRSR